MTETPEQWEAAVEHLLSFTIALVEHPGAIDFETLSIMLLSVADRRDKNGDYGAGRLLEAWAERVKAHADGGDHA